MEVSGQFGDLSCATVDSWKVKLPDTVHCYSTKGMWNIDKTGHFWCAVPDKGLNQKMKAYKGVKQSKQNITVTLIVNSAGESEAMPIATLKSDNPRFERVNKSQLPVHYFSQNKAWMTGDALDQVQSKLNRSPKVNGR